ncbi:MAG: sigma 54-interacting transcriptional regulator, partial [Bacteroidota bacterium]
FGHKKGSFTDALEDQEGLIVAAQGGTLFLDEIGDISPSMQLALLRVLQEKVITPVGGTEEVSVDVRIIAATNRKLWEACQEGRFRWDLYYRLTETRLRLPALREYPVEDRKAFFQHFLGTKAAEFERSPLSLSAEVESLLLAHEFPGNLRELENIITHFYVFAEGIVQRQDMPEDLLDRYPLEDLSMETAKRKHAEKVYALCQHNLSEASRVLAVSANSLRKYLKG